VKEDPARLAGCIERLDALVGTDGWDILYTDMDYQDYPLYREQNDFQSDLKGILPELFWRPDMPSNDLSRYAKRSPIDQEFLKIGSRMRTHSMIIRKSGMEKILQFEKSRKMYLPIDHEIAMIPNIRLYSLRHHLVTSAVSVSDTRERYFR
jgi:hypothetical protein